MSFDIPLWSHSHTLFSHEDLAACIGAYVHTGAGFGEKQGLRTQKVAIALPSLERTC
jgi:hypothetical protein